VQAKGARERLGVVQIEQDLAMCRNKFPDLTVIPIAAQFLADNVIALLALAGEEEGIAVSDEKHYVLVPAHEITAGDLMEYRRAARRAAR
jgi:hypothetical protein